MRFSLWSALAAPGWIVVNLGGSGIESKKLENVAGLHAAFGSSRGRSERG